MLIISPISLHLGLKTWWKWFLFIKKYTCIIWTIFWLSFSEGLPHLTFVLSHLSCSDLAIKFKILMRVDIYKIVPCFYSRFPCIRHHTFLIWRKVTLTYLVNWDAIIIWSPKKFSNAFEFPLPPPCVVLEMANGCSWSD